jgi:hypothetical protein
MSAFFQDYNPKIKKQRENAIFYSENIAPTLNKKFENFNNSNSNDELIKHLTKTNENINLQKLFFSSENIDLINKQIILTIYKKTNYKINFQRTDKLIIVMQYFFNEYAKHLSYNYKQQISELNCKVVSNIIGDIITNFEQKIVYLRDIEKNKDPLPLPVSSTVSRTLQVKPYW